MRILLAFLAATILALTGCQKAKTTDQSSASSPDNTATENAAPADSSQTTQPTDQGSDMSTLPSQSAPAVPDASQQATPSTPDQSDINGSSSAPTQQPIAPNTSDQGTIAPAPEAAPNSGQTNPSNPSTQPNQSDSQDSQQQQQPNQPTVPSSHDGSMSNQSSADTQVGPDQNIGQATASNNEAPSSEEASNDPLGGNPSTPVSGEPDQD